ncbi:MAG: hypothetical protein OEW97_02565 [Gammaproteobacteria bacterium]|nr:hypothetical protein [Gammaproteobacteria bacterium]
MRKPVEIIQGEKSLRLNIYLVIASYLLLLQFIEPMIDFVLLHSFEQKSIAVVDYLDHLKRIVSIIVYTLMGCVPALFFAWYGYRIVASSKLPPVLLSGKTRFPFTVIVIKGKAAKMFGVLIIIVSLVLIFQLLLNLVSTLMG